MPSSLSHTQFTSFGFNGLTVQDGRVLITRRGSRLQAFGSWLPKAWGALSARGEAEVKTRAYITSDYRKQKLVFCAGDSLWPSRDHRSRRSAPMQAILGGPRRNN